MKNKNNKPNYNRVFVLAGEMEKTNGGHDFLEEDKYGSIHGKIRVEAIKILRNQGRVKEIIVVGGPTKDGKSKAQLIATRIGGKVTKLESEASTGGNFETIEKHLNKNGCENNDGLLTNFYHLPRTLRLISNKGFKLIPICAEAVLLTDKSRWVKNIKEWYRHPSMVDRIHWEIQGLSDIEEGNYK